MPENTAKGVSSNTSAINVEQSTQQFSAQYKPLNTGLVELNQKETLLKYQALHSPPVTPVRDRLPFQSPNLKSVLAQPEIARMKFA